MSATEIFAHILIFWFDVDGLVHCSGVLMLTQPQIKIMLVGVSMLHRYNAILYLFSDWCHATLCGMLEGPPGHCGVSTQSKCRCQSSEKCETKLFAILLGVSNSRIDISYDYTNHDWWPVCSIGRHQILTLQISVASHDCEMKLKSTVHFIEASLSKPHGQCQYMVV